jgi:hypothetical protein
MVVSWYCKQLSKGEKLHFTAVAGTLRAKKRPATNHLFLFAPTIRRCRLKPS